MIINEEKCTRCKKCESVCPTQSFDIETPQTVNECIACYQCIAVCPNGAFADSDKQIGSYYQVNISPQEFELLMQQRRSCRQFKSTPINPEILKEFIMRMRFSPTASNAQNLQFTIIQDPKLLKQINDGTIETITKAFNKGVNAWTTPLIKWLKGKECLNAMLHSKRKFLNKANS